MGLKWDLHVFIYFLVFVSNSFSQFFHIQDLNPIENMWAQMKRYIEKTAKPRTAEELAEGIKAFWATVTPALCRRYIRHQHKVLPVVVEREGAASGY